MAVQDTTDELRERYPDLPALSYRVQFRHGLWMETDVRACPQSPPCEQRAHRAHSEYGCWCMSLPRTQVPAARVQALPPEESEALDEAEMATMDQLLVSGLAAPAQWTLPLPGQVQPEVRRVEHGCGASWSNALTCTRGGGPSGGSCTRHCRRRR